MTMTPQDKAAALILAVPFAAAVMAVLVWWFVGQVQNLRRADPEPAGELTDVIPWVEPEQRQLPDWVDDPTAYRGEFEDILDQFAATDPTFADDMERLGQCLAANPEETR